jgi:NAD(P)-dependent dehydrogenase (short-subunit alcohol dehydrogenase family)
MLLEDRTAIVYGGGGAIGAAVAGGFAREGARVYLAGRNIAALDVTARTIRAAGGVAEPAIVDALDLAAVESHAAAVARQSGGIDIVFNAISNDDLQGIPLIDMDFEDFMLPITKSMTAHYNISTAVARQMMTRGRGVILAMGGGREAIPNLGGAHVAWAALAGLCRQLAAELGPHGIRVAWLLSPGSPDPSSTYGNVRTEARTPDVRPDDPFASATLLKRRPTYDDVANVAVFLASDWAATMTATEVNITGGSVVD